MKIPGISGVINEGLMCFMFKRLFFVLTVTWSCFALAQEKNLTLTVDAKSLQFTVSLPANPTTGYRWKIVKYDHSLLKCVKENYKSSFPQRIGSGGETEFIFKRKNRQLNPQSSSIIFSYERPWENNNQNITNVNIIFKK